jgi:RimJ/RimL family protein N-acetyltransferase
MMSLEKKEMPKAPEDVIAAGQAQNMATGTFIRLRAVQEEDLEQLAALLAQTPCPRELLPWTTQRLKKKYNDEKEPGLWGRRERLYLAVRVADGQLVGYIDERERWTCRDIHLHVADGAEDRDALGGDMLSAYMRMILDWHDQVRFEVFLLASETQKQQWLAAAGFEREVVFTDYYMHEGRSDSLYIWGWINPRLENGDAP